MIAGIFHKGSGLGDQLFRYITARTLALDKGFDFGMLNSENFKGKDFINLDMGIEHTIKHPLFLSGYPLWEEKDVRDSNGVDIRSYDPEINFVEDNTIIEGNFEDSKYWGHRLPEIREWLKIEPLEMPDDLCVISGRGGEYKTVKDLLLTKDYYERAIEKMKQVNPKMKFVIHSDDKELFTNWFPQYEVIQNIEVNWRSIRFANYLIISNSAFAIIPSLLGNAKLILAPRWWARHNIKIWARPANFYNRFTYIE